MSFRVASFTHPLIGIARDLLVCNDKACSYRHKIEGYLEAYVAFEVATRDAYIGLREPVLKPVRDSRIYSQEAEEIAREMPRDRREFILSAVEYTRRAIRYREQASRIGIQEALRLGIGDCEEYTDLLASLLAARGFTVRRVVGITPGGLHARLEYKSHSGRVPIDATRNQVGFVDRFHVPIFIGNRRPVKIPRGGKIERLEAKLVRI